jgi:hypothetical protein
MATTTTSLARGTSHAALATRTRPRAVRRHRVAVRANAKPDAAYPGDSDDVDDEDLAYDATEMTYADLPSVPGGSTLDVSRAFTVDIDPSIVANAMPNRGVLEYVRLPANEYNVLDSSAVQRNRRRDVQDQRGDSEDTDVGDRTGGHPTDRAHP